MLIKIDVGFMGPCGSGERLMNCDGKKYGDSPPVNLYIMTYKPPYLRSFAS
jgi:hypothetical protein